MLLLVVLFGGCRWGGCSVVFIWRVVFNTCYFTAAIFLTIYQLWSVRLSLLVFEIFFMCHFPSPRCPCCPVVPFLAVPFLVMLLWWCFVISSYFILWRVTRCSTMSFVERILYSNQCSILDVCIICFCISFADLLVCRRLRAWRRGRRDGRQSKCACAAAWSSRMSSNFLLLVFWWCVLVIISRINSL